MMLIVTARPFSSQIACTFIVIPHREHPINLSLTVFGPHDVQCALQSVESMTCHSIFPSFFDIPQIIFSKTLAFAHRQNR
jgi:hypothetical protein